MKLFHRTNLDAQRYNTVLLVCVMVMVMVMVMVCVHVPVTAGSEDESPDLPCCSLILENDIEGEMVSMDEFPMISS